MKQILSEHDVLALLNFELSAYEECAGCRFTAIRPGSAADAPGCNWRGAELRYGDEPTETVRRITERVIGEVREKYDVARYGAG